MEKIKVDVYVRGDIAAVGNIGYSGENLHCGVSPDDPRYDLSQAIVIGQGCECGSINVPAGKCVAAEHAITAKGMASSVIPESIIVCNFSKSIVSLLIL